MARPDDMSHLTPISCQELVELVTNYFEGALSPADRARFEAHLGGCSGCQTYLSQLQDTLRLLGSLAEADIPDEAREYLLRVFRNWKRGA